MTTTVLLIMAYLLLVILGAEAVVCGAARLARNLHINEFVIGMVIVGFGTSLPELVVSLTGTLEGNPDVCVGNIVGTNIFNLLGILGLSAIIMPLQFTAQNRRFELPAAVLITLFALAASLSGHILGRGEGIAMLILMAAFTFWSIANSQVEQTAESIVIDPSTQPADASCCLPAVRCHRGRHIFVLCLLILVGLAILLVGGYLLVNQSVLLAEMLGVSDRMIAILLLATGTSLPELVTSIAAARRGMGQLVLGNILGSNIFNLLFILGLSATIQPLEVGGMYLVDWLAFGLSMLLLFLFAAPRPHRMTRWHGLLFVLLMAVYTIVLFECPG